jgi:hypothetical protein
MPSNDLTITAEIKNQGDLRVGPGVVIGFTGLWNAGSITEPLYADSMMTPLTFVLQTSLEPGQSIFINVPYDALNNTPMVLPDTITVIAAQSDVARECDETNNELTIPVQAGAMEPDLRVELGSPSPTPTCPTVSFNTVIPAFSQGLQITIWALVDPDDVIDECNDGNNSDAADQAIQCGGIN